MTNSKTGYGRPPKDKQFKKGQSGNPSGRPKRNLLNFSELIAEVASKEVIVKEGGKRKKVVLMHAVIMKVMQGALQGDKLDLRLALNLLRSVETQKDFEPMQKDEQALKDFIKRMTPVTGGNDE